MPKPKPTHAKSVRRRAPPEAPARRREEVLEAALELIAEHGIAGASLRRLASRLGMSQPSLYHYFDSKQALIAEIVEYCAAKMLDVSLEPEPPKKIEDVPRYVKDAVLGVWATDRHPRFMSFLFVVAIESQDHRAVIQRVLEERLHPGLMLLAEAFGRTPAERRELEQVVKMVTYSLAFQLMEERALLRRAATSRALREHADWLVAVGRRLLAPPKRASKGSGARAPGCGGTTGVSDGIAEHAARCQARARRTRSAYPSRIAPSIRSQSGWSAWLDFALRGSAVRARLWERPEQHRAVRFVLRPVDQPAPAEGADAHADAKPREPEQQGKAPEQRVDVDRGSDHQRHETDRGREQHQVVLHARALITLPQASRPLGAVLGLTDVDGGSSVWGERAHGGLS
jgi:AcrR family transcriptional regulator